MTVLPRKEGTRASRGMDVFMRKGATTRALTTGANTPVPTISPNAARPARRNQR